MQICRLTSVLLFFALLASQASAISLSQSLDKAAIAYEDSATFHITITWQGSQAAYRFERPIQPTLEKLRVQQYSTSITSTGSGPSEVSTKKFVYTLVPVGSGTARIEPMTVHYLSWPDSLPGELVTEPMTLQVAAAKPQPRPGKGLAGLSIWTLVIIWAVVVGGVGTGVLVFVRKRLKRQKEIVKTPTELFLEKLAALRDESGSDLKRFQTGLYKHMTWFLNAQYGIDVSHRTAEEIADSIKNLNLSAADKEKLTEWLLRADREKFTPLPPMPGETIRLETEIRQFFENLQSRK